MSKIGEWFGWVVEDRGRRGRRGRGVGGGKDFLGGARVLERVDGREKVKWFVEGEVWQCCIGMNVGVEMYGKKRWFSRPVLVLKRVNRGSFWGVPLTHTKKDLPGWYRYGDGCFVLEQVRFYDARRLDDRDFVVGAEDFEKIKGAFLEYAMRG